MAAACSQEVAWREPWLRTSAAAIVRAREATVRIWASSRENREAAGGIKQGRDMIRRAFWRVPCVPGAPAAAHGLPVRANVAPQGRASQSAELARAGGFGALRQNVPWFHCTP